MGKLILIPFLLLFLSCIHKGKSPNPELEHVLKINNCDSLERDSIYLKYRNFKLPITKPKTMRDAIVLLDSASNDFYKHHVKVCPQGDLYFELGLTLRNEWVRQGENEFNILLSEKLKISHIDATSGLILTYYKKHLNGDTTSILSELGKSFEADSMKDVRNEILKMESQLKKEQ